MDHYAFATTSTKSTAEAVMETASGSRVRSKMVLYVLCSYNGQTGTFAVRLYTPATRDPLNAFMESWRKSNCWSVASSAYDEPKMEGSRNSVYVLLCASDTFLLTAHISTRIQMTFVDVDICHLVASLRKILWPLPTFEGKQLKNLWNGTS